MIKSIMRIIGICLLFSGLYLCFNFFSIQAQARNTEPELTCSTDEKRVIDSEEIEEFASEVRKDKISEEVQKYTVSIFGLGRSLGFCSGVLIKESKDYSYVITCKHCVSPTEETLIENVQASAVFSPMDEDLSLVIIRGKIPEKTPVSLARHNPKLQEELVHVGYPTMKLFDSIGKVLRTSKDWHWAGFKSKRGCSGGGVYNIQKELVGILWGRLMFDDISIYEPVSDIRVFLKKVDAYIKVMKQ